METRKDGDSESIYINVEDSKSACHSEIYENFWPNTETTNPDPEVVSEARQVRSGNPAAVCLGLLCVLLLAVIIGLSVKYKAEREQIQASFDNLTTERDGLQNKLSNIEASICPLGWRKFMSSCYYVSPSSNTWEKSRQDCRGKGAHLVIINSKEEQIFVSGLATNFWIGLSDKESERSWKWVDGTFLNSRYWMPGEPNSGRLLRNNYFVRESCVQVSSSSHDILTNWRDVLCDKLHSWICEKTTQCVFK